jgi:hypothetical protein
LTGEVQRTISSTALGTSRSERDQVVAEGLHHSHGLAVHLAVGEQARQIARRVRTAVLDDRVEELEELQPQRLHGRRPVLALALEVRIVGGEELVGEPEELGLLLARHPEDAGEDA